VNLPKSQEKREVLLKEVQDLVVKRALEPITDSSPGFYSHLFVVKKKTGGFRPVIDLKNLNRHIYCPHFRMETDRSIRAQLKEGEWTTSIDLSDAYLHIPIHPRFRRFLRIHIMGQTFQFKAMCFGLNVAPRVFTKLLDPVASYLRSRGIHLHRYLDDWLICGPTPLIVLSHTREALNLFSRLGFLVNRKKSDLVPRTRFIFLGMDIDLVKVWVYPTTAEIQKISAVIAVLKRVRQVKVRYLLSLLGLLNHAAQFIHLGRLHLRPLQMYVKIWSPNLRDSIDHYIPLEKSFYQALAWWEDSQRLSLGVPLHLPDPSITLTTDASLSGWGGFLEGHQVRGVWSPQEKLLHISHLELRAVRLALLALVHQIEGKSVRLLSDNTVAVAYIRNQGGTHSVSLYKEARDLLIWCSQHQVVLHPFYLPGHLNSVADILSRESQILGTEWTLHIAVFRRILSLIPSLDVDLFATRLNNQLQRFVSPCPDPLAWKVDAFSIEWVEMVPYAFPPTKLIPEVLKKLRRSQIRLYLVAPYWPNQSWFPEVLGLLWDLPLQLPHWNHLLRQPQRNIFHQNPGLLNLHVWPLSGVVSDRQVFLERLRDMPRHINDLHHYDCTNLTGGSSPVGVMSGTSIPPLLLFSK
jgi:hypothetical protein